MIRNVSKCAIINVEMSDNMSLVSIFMVVTLPALFVGLITPIVKKLAFMIGATDKPNDRKVHKTIMPRLGGVGIFAGFLLGVIIFNKIIVPELSVGQIQNNVYSIMDVALKYKQLNAILLSSFVIVFVGVLDDMVEIRALIKLIAQISAALIIVYYGEIRLESISAFGININFSFYAHLITILWIIGITNAINLIDGLDGLACGISGIYFFTIAMVALFATYYDSNIHEFVRINDIFTATLALIMLGTCIGFLFHNFNPATIFMGDSGSLFLGLIIAILPLLGFKNVTLLSLIVPLLILAVPTMDVFFAIFRRAIKGKPLSAPDKDHIHHQLINMKLGHRNTVLVIYFISALFSSVALLFTLVSKELAIYLFVFLSVIVLIFVETTSILTEEFKPITHFIHLITLKKNK